MNILEIIKQLPQDTTFYCTLTGEMEEVEIIDIPEYPLKLTINMPESYKTKVEVLLSKDGKYFFFKEGGECILFPSKEHRDWSDWRKFYGITL